MTKTCENCTNEAVKGWRFCKDCKKAMIAKMRADGYLQPKIFGSTYRTSEQREDQYETVNGRDDIK